MPIASQTLPLLGAHLAAPGDQGETHYMLGAEDGAELAGAHDRLQQLWANIELQSAGLSHHISFSLIRLYAGAASQYALRQGSASAASIDAYDTTLRQVVAACVGRPLSDAQWTPGLPTCP